MMKWKLRELKCLRAFKCPCQDSNPDCLIPKLALLTPQVCLCPSRRCMQLVVQLSSRVRLFVTPWTAACQASLSLTISQSLPKFMSTESVMSSNHLILCCSLLLLPSIFPSIRVFSNESALRIRWLKYWNFSISPSNEDSGLISYSIDWFDPPTP